VRVDFTALQHASAFEAARALGYEPWDTGIGAAPAAVHIVDVPDVLYLPDVLAPGQSICLLPSGQVPVESVLDPFAVRFLAAFRDHGHTIGPRYQDSFDVARCAARVCIVGNLFSRNFGHWTEELLKVAVLLERQEDCQFVMPSTLPPFATDLLRLVGVEPARILYTDRPTLFERAVFSTAIDHRNLADYPAVLDLLRQRLLANIANPSRFGKRLWLERGQQLRNGGLTLNPGDVYRCLEPFGFDVVDLGSLAVADQLATVRAAEVIAGAHGSQFVHAQFMPVASAVVECFSPLHVNASILPICRVLRHQYRQIVARCNTMEPYRHGRDCLVDCEHLSLVLESVCG
jgi:capsular polysaccharide biosynthesis protein